MKYIPGLSADMEDLLSEKGQNDLNHFFTRFLWATKENIFTVPKSKQEMPKLANIKNSPTEDDVKKSLETKDSSKDLVIITDSTRPRWSTGDCLVAQ